MLIGGYKVRTITSDVITTFAGSGSSSPTNSLVPATSVNLSGVLGVAIDPQNGDVYVADTDHYVITAITRTSLIASTFAGSGSSGSGGDGGTATSATIDRVYGLRHDSSSNSLYLAVFPLNTVRKVYSQSPSVAPTRTPTVMPTVVPTELPSQSPSRIPTVLPSFVPTTTQPTLAPTQPPTALPTVMPTLLPTVPPSHPPTLSPTLSPTVAPSLPPTLVPTQLPTVLPSHTPTVSPTLSPSLLPTMPPSINPTVTPTSIPTFSPTCGPTLYPTLTPTQAPSTEGPTVVVAAAQSSNSSGVIGGAIGGVVGGILVVILVVWWYRRQIKAEQKVSPDNDDVESGKGESTDNRPATTTPATVEQQSVNHSQKHVSVAQSGPDYLHCDSYNESQVPGAPVQETIPLEEQNTISQSKKPQNDTNNEDFGTGKEENAEHGSDASNSVPMEEKDVIRQSVTPFSQAQLGDYEVLQMDKGGIVDGSSRVASTSVPLEDNSVVRHSEKPFSEAQTDLSHPQHDSNNDSQQHPAQSPRIKTDVFLTHDWGEDGKNHREVSRVNAELQKRGLVTWFDEERMEGNIPHKMVEGIENTKVVVVFITDRYRNKVNTQGKKGVDNCRYEFRYAVQERGPDYMVPVVMEEKMKDTTEWKGELGGALSTYKYIDMTQRDDEEVFQSKCDELHRSICRIIKTCNASEHVQTGLNLQ